MHAQRRWLWAWALVVPLWAAAQSPPPAIPVSTASVYPLDKGWTVKVEDGNSISRLVAPLLQGPNRPNLYQALMATYLANPHAFMQGNASRLVVGAVVAIPRLADVRKVDIQEARDWWQAQQDWFGTNLTLPSAIDADEASLPPASESSLADSALESAGTEAEPQSPQIPAEAESSVALAPLPTSPPGISLVAWIAAWPLWVWAFIGLTISLIVGISLVTPDRPLPGSAARVKPKRPPVAPAGQHSAMVIDDELPPLDEDDDLPLSHPPKRSLPAIDLNLGSRS